MTWRPNKAVAKACSEYRMSLGHDRCEVTQLIVADREAAAWISRHGCHKTEVHHIFGRGRKPEFNWFCNLIQISKSTHDWLHDRHPTFAELACLRAKLTGETDRIGQKRPEHPVESARTWNPDVMGMLIHRDSLAGRVSELLSRDGVTGTIFERHGREIESFLGFV